ncbi:MAG: tetratricopeptide repeat protein [Oligoflexia bacterium]|nr:tetratricopeptide repeat protein [Oligoflexia bacterium]
MVLFDLGDIVGDDALMKVAVDWNGQDDAGTQASMGLRAAMVLHRTGKLDEAAAKARDAADAAEQANDPRLRAICLGQVADIHMARGELDEALRIRTHEELPVYEKLGDVRSRAVTLGKVADIHMDRGELDEALRIRTHKQLPVYEMLGDVRSRAITLGKLADIHMARGELDEALRIRTHEELPVYEKLGDVREMLVARTNIAIALATRGRREDGPEIIRLLRAAHQAAVDSGYTALQTQIEQIMVQFGIPNPDSEKGSG